jgi:glycine betaine/proline transport system substrate-binding protein
MRLLLPALGLLVLASATPAQAAGYCDSGKTVTFAGIDWDSGAFLTEAIKAILAKGYGCKVDSIPGTTVLLEQALSENEVQIFTEEWTDRTEVWKRAFAQHKVAAIGHPFRGATEGWFVPSYVIEGDPKRNIKPVAPDLSTVEQLSDPKYIKLFEDPEEPGKGRFLNCPSGYACEGLSTALLEGYKLDQKWVNFRPGTGAALEAEVTAAYLRGEPVLFAHWIPSALAARLKLTKLKGAPYSDACWAVISVSEGKHDTACDFPEPNVAYAVSSSFVTDAPEIIAFLEKATFPLEVFNRSLLRIADDKISAADAAEEFLKTKPDVWRPWVSTEAAQKIEAAVASH